MTGDLAVWFRAQLDADEQTARAALGHRWVGYPRRQSVEVAEGDQVGVKVVAAPTNFEHWENRPDYAAGPQTFEHIALHDPAFTLADITAKRTIIDAYLSERARRDIYQADDVRALEDDEQLRRRRSSAARCRGLEIAVELLAQQYAGRPGWHNEWTTT